MTARPFDRGGAQLVRAAVVEVLEGPLSIAVTDVAEPRREPGEVLVQVAAAGLAYPEVLLSRGRYQVRPDPPFVPGTEAAGTVVAADAGGPFSVGQRVVTWCGLGGLSERVSVPAWRVLPVPDAMPLDDAAAMVLNYGTAYLALAGRARLRPGERVLVHGAAGGVGTAAMQVAHGLGAGAVVGVVSTDERGEAACAAGADEYLLSDDLAARARELEVDVVVDPVGGDRFVDSLRSLRPGGRLLVIGFTGGSIPEVRVNRLLLGNTSVVGVGWGALVRRRPQLLARHWSALCAMYADGHLRPVIGERVSLTEVGSALARLEERETTGKTVVRIGERHDGGSSSDVVAPTLDRCDPRHDSFMQ